MIVKKSKVKIDVLGLHFCKKWTDEKLDSNSWAVGRGGGACDSDYADYIKLRLEEANSPRRRE